MRPAHFRYTQPETDAHRRGNIGRLFRAFMLGATFGGTALACKILGLDALLQGWVALAVLVVTIDARRP